MKTLGLDIGTNSIGWGIVNEKEHKIEKCGVYIFPEGVKIEKGKESSKAAERTAYRSARRLKFRRKLRKYETLKVLIRNNMCPLTIDELEKWRKDKIYPTSKEFINWYRTDELNNWEPYFLRKKCVEKTAEKYEIGRALYHLAQRRGFLSNRKDSTQESDGKVSTSIDSLSKAMGEKTLGQYFYEIKQTGEKVRGKYTSRKEHYEKEFYKICEAQNISNELQQQLYNAIFYQRKLKSQKFLVGKCTFETDKPRCPISHFDFEEYRMLSFINNIKIERNSTEDDKQDNLPLTKEEIELIKPLFFRISKPIFDFKDISKKLAGKNEYWKFNYRDDTKVPGCPISTSLKNIFGDNWKEINIDNYDIYDIWHVLFDFDNDEKLHEFALNKLHLNSEKTEAFCKIHFQQGYANLSLKAIRKILPFLQKGYGYSQAVFLANIPTMIGKDTYAKDFEKIENEIKTISSTLKEKNNIISLTNLCLDAIFKDKEHDFRTEEWNKSIIDEKIKELFGVRKWSHLYSKEEQDFIKKDVITKIEDSLKIAITKNANDYKYSLLRTDNLIMDYLLKQGYQIKKGTDLYHPSDTDYNFEIPKEAEDGKLYLGSPRTASVKNPVAMRALYQLRKLLNYLIKTGEIDSETRIHIELANEVNDKNWRKAIEDFQKNNGKNNIDAEKRIIELCKEQGFSIVPTESDIKKYRLWKEQNEMCPYTGKKINITELFGPNPKFDFEHTIPRSYSYDDSLENLTLCDSEFNRSVKKQHIPSELPNFDEINARFQRFYAEKIDSCLSIISKNQVRGGYIDPVVKDSMIVRRHKAELELNYYKGKLKRFVATDVTSGFKHSQLNDTRIITKFALQYVKSVFPNTFPVKGNMTDLFKRQWGLLERNETKDRSNYRHHAIDALTIACIDRTKFNLLSEAIRKSSDGVHLKFDKPWDTFDNDVINAVQYIIPKHFVDDNSLRQTKRVLKDRYGKPILKNGKKVYITGNTARGSLHKDTFYGCIMTPPQKNIPSEKIFVQRVAISTLTKESAEKIVDKKIRETFINNIETGIQTITDIQTNGLLITNTKDGHKLYVKNIRIKAKPSNPLILKKHNNVISNNPKEYKQNYYVVNDENYFIALYRGKDEKGNIIADYEVSTLLESIKNKQNNKPLYKTELNKKGKILQLYKILKKGKTIILKESENEDILSLPKKDLWNRIYLICGIENDGGRLNLKQVINNKYEKPSFNPPLSEKANNRRISVNQLSILVEGEDFMISPLGEIIRK